MALIDKLLCEVTEGNDTSRIPPSLLVTVAASAVAGGSENPPFMTSHWAQTQLHKCVIINTFCQKVKENMNFSA